MTALTSPTTAVPGVSTTLDGFIVVHEALRVGARQMAAAMKVITPATAPSLAQCWTMYVDGLTSHHHGEDEVIFPIAAERDPVFGELAASTALEHLRLDQLIVVANAAVARATADPTSASGRAAAATIESLADELEAHLAREEFDILPRVAAAITADEMAAIERSFVRKIGIRRLGLTIVALEQAGQRVGIGPPPPPFTLRVLLPRWRRQRARMLAAAGVVAEGDA